MAQENKSSVPSENAITISQFQNSITVLNQMTVALKAYASEMDIALQKTKKFQEALVSGIKKDDSKGDGKEKGKPAASANVMDEKKRLETIDKLDQDYANKIYERDTKQSVKLTKQRDAELAKVTGDEKKALEARLKIRNWYDKQISAAEKKEADEEEENRKARKEKELKFWIDVCSYTSQTLSVLGDAIGQYYQAQINDETKTAGEIKKLKEDQFRMKQAFAFAEALIDGAGAVIKAIKDVPYPFNIPYAIVIGALAAAKAYAIASQPMPAFAAGGLAPGGMALVGEYGAEVVNLPAGARVYNNQQSQQMLSGGDTFNITINGGIQTSDPVDFRNQMIKLARYERARS